MSKPFIFISCGQFTEAEKALGREIAAMVRKLTDLEPFFAEEVQDLNGLDANILNALRDCVAFITVLHPRGTITRPDKAALTRASVWIEQEIGIATYIQRTEKRPLPIIAFKHKSVGREGIRDLLHLNPIEFTHESEVLEALPKRLQSWRSLAPSGIRIQLDSVRSTPQQNHPIRTLRVTLVNGTSQRFTQYDVEVRLPAGILKHWNSTYTAEVHSDEPGRRCFRFNEQGRGALNPHDKKQITFDYCTKCAADEYQQCGEIPDLAADEVIDAKAWVENREYTEKKSIKQLAEERENPLTPV